ncbi:MAG: DNA repair exonuclease [archaeon]
MKFAHLGDCHLGSWRYPALQELNLQSFKRAIDLCIKEGVDFVLIAGDLFDSAYPPIDILKEAFSTLKKLKESKISCFIIAGSHDYSVSGKTFLDVLEKAGFCKNVHLAEEKEDSIILNPVIHNKAAIYGYPGKKSGLEVQELKKIKLNESPGFFKILMLHTSIKDAVGRLPIEYVDETKLPKADYYALGHLHINYRNKNIVYSSPIFPNNFQEIEELKYGGFYIVETNPFNCWKVDLKLKEVELIELQIDNTLIATEYIISEINKRNIRDKIILLRLSGEIKKGKTSNINFIEIENYAKSKGAYVLLKSTSGLLTKETKIEVETNDVDELEKTIFKKYSEENPSQFNSLIDSLINSLSLEKQEDEKSIIFNDRLMSEVNRILNIQ